MQHLLHAAQHSVTREEMAGQFSLAEKLNREWFDAINMRLEQAEKLNQGCFDAVNTRFEQVEKRFDVLTLEH